MKTALLFLVSALALLGPKSFAQCDPTLEVVALVFTKAIIDPGKVRPDGSGWSGRFTSVSTPKINRVGPIECEITSSISATTSWLPEGGVVTRPAESNMESLSIPGVRSSLENTPYQGVHYRKYIYMSDNAWILVKGPLGEVKKFIEDPQKDVLKFERTYQGGAATGIREVVAIWSNADYNARIDNRLPDVCLPKTPRVCYQQVSAGVVTYLQVVDCDSCPSCDDLDDDDDCDKPIQINFQQPPSGQ